MEPFKGINYDMYYPSITYSLETYTNHFLLTIKAVLSVVFSFNFESYFEQLRQIANLNKEYIFSLYQIYHLE